MHVYNKCLYKIVFHYFLQINIIQVYVCSSINKIADTNLLLNNQNMIHTTGAIHDHSEFQYWGMYNVKLLNIA